LLAMTHFPTPILRNLFGRFSACEFLLVSGR